MKILVIGATGTIGGAVAQALEARHEVLRASHARSAFAVDLADPPLYPGAMFGLRWKKFVGSYRFLSAAKCW
jgi:uncharacterized protein YbjT (DUF2867 family)